MCPKKRYILPTGHPTLSPNKSTYCVSQLSIPYSYMAYSYMAYSYMAYSYMAYSYMAYSYPPTHTPAPTYWTKMPTGHPTLSPEKSTYYVSKKRYILPTGHPTLSPNKSTYCVSQLIGQ